MLDDTYHVTVQITSQDMADGVCLDCQRCPVMLALFRAAKDAGIPATGGSVNGFDADLYIIHTAIYSAELPDEIVELIRAIDCQEEHISLPAPFTLTLTRDDEDGEDDEACEDDEDEGIGHWPTMNTEE